VQDTDTLGFQLPQDVERSRIRRAVIDHDDLDGLVLAGG
jgi:hypothetical protein